MSTLGLVVNPLSGSGQGVTTGRHVHERLRAAGHAVVDLSAPTLAQATDRARAAATAGLDALVVVGGDGAVHLAANVVAGSDLPIGIVPAGTGNDLARALGIDHDPRAALDALLAALRHAPRRIDALRVGAPGRAAYEWCLGVLSCGLDAAVNARANSYRWPQGHLRYLRAVVASVGRFRPYGYRVELDGEPVWSQAGTLLAVANTEWIGGGLRIAPDADPEDGKAEVLLADALNVAGIANLFPKLYSGGHIGDPRVHVRHARSVLVAPDPALGARPPVAYADGERIGPLPLHVQVVPAALGVLV
jgi:diacylglycerol kinase (ATP)